VFRRHAILGPYILLRQLLRLIHLSCQLHTTIAFEVQPQRFLSTNYISIRFYITGTLFRDKTNDETIYIIEQRRPVFALSFSRRRGRLFICIAYSSYYSHYVTRYGLKIHIRLWLDLWYSGSGLYVPGNCAAIQDRWSRASLGPNVFVFQVGYKG